MYIMDYVNEVKDESFYDLAINKLDILVFTLLSYIQFDGLAPESYDPYHAPRLDQLAPYLDKKSPTLTMTKNHLDLLRLASKTLRYKSVKVMAYINDIDPDMEKQFSATTFRLTNQTYLISYRGTDESLVGWKEDFHMTYMSHIPSQALAQAYLRDALTILEGDFILSGHSKGGNLATFAASQISPNLAQKIQSVYSFDAPGLHQKIIESPGYQGISPMIQRFIPQGSIVGMMLEIPETAAVVESRALGGIRQHDPFSWKIAGHDFLLAKGLNADSLQVDQTLKAWTDHLSDQELKEFWDLFFKLLRDADIESTADFFRFSMSSKLIRLIQNHRRLDPDQADMLKRVTNLLLELRVEALKEHVSLPPLFNRLEDKEDA